MTTIPNDKTLRTCTSAQVQSCQHDPAAARSATPKRRDYVAKNAFRDKIPRRQNPRASCQPGLHWAPSLLRNKNSGPSPRLEPLFVDCFGDCLASQPQLKLVRAAAHRRAIEADLTARAALAALLEAFAERLNLLAALLVAARAGDGAAVFRVLPLAFGEREAALAAAHAVLAAAARAAPLAQHPAELLQRAASNLVVALALDLAAVLGLLELDLAPRHDVPVGNDGLGDWAGCRPIC
jgi:hypothetical protein